MFYCIFCAMVLPCSGVQSIDISRNELSYFGVLFIRIRWSAEANMHYLGVSKPVQTAHPMPGRFLSKICSFFRLLKLIARIQDGHSLILPAKPGRPRCK